MSTQPLSALGDIALDESALWSLLTMEPATSVCVLSDDFEVLFANDQAARLYLGHQADADRLIGRNMRALLPDDVADVWMVFHRGVRMKRSIEIIRLIWQGHQHLTWLQYVDSPADFESDAGAGHFLSVTRRVTGDLREYYDCESPMSIAEAQHIHLGELDVLTSRELEVLALIGQGMSTAQIASVLGCAAKTVEKHREAIGRKLQRENRVELADIARRAGLTLRDAGRKRVALS